MSIKCDGSFIPRVQERIDQPSNPSFSLDCANKHLMRSEVAKCVACNNVVRRTHIFVYNIQNVVYPKITFRLHKNNEIFDLQFRSLDLIEKKEDLSSIRAAIAPCKWAELISHFLAGVSMRPVTCRATYAGFHFRRAQIVQCGQPTTRSGRTSDITLDCKRTSRSKRRFPQTIRRRGSFPRLVKEKVMRNGAEETLT